MSGIIPAMNAPRVSAIVAIGNNHELGKDNELIWRISDDLKRVKELTTGHVIIMGRKNFESIGRPLPNRTNIVISRNPGFNAEGVIPAKSFKDALQKARSIEKNEVFVFGGAQVYTEALPYTQRLYLTMIDAEEKDSDVFFPPFKDEFPKKISEEKRFDKKTGLSYTWITLER